VLCKDTAPLPKTGYRAPKFLAYLYCGQTAGCIKMPLGTEIGLGLRDIVFDVDPATPRKRTHPLHPIFGPCLLEPSGWMDEGAAWYGSRPRPGPHCTTGRGPSSRERGTTAPPQQPPSFRPCLLWPRSPISATAELLYFLSLCLDISFLRNTISRERNTISRERYSYFVGTNYYLRERNNYFVGTK